jgi:hypothetical protein|tara:strand:- start:2653 stop:2829 length:177 start_codon:yes stop_codon:yes gene_type:complete
MAMRNTSFGSSKYGEAMSKLGDKIEKKAARAPQVIRNARIKASGAKGGMGSKGRTKAK